MQDELQPTKALAAVPGLVLRAWIESDQSAVSRLYSDGLLAGQISPNDSGADLEYVREAYFDCERHHFWVAELKGEIVGMIGVGSDSPNTAEIRRLRVLPDAQNQGIECVLLETAVNHCRSNNFLKVRLDTRFEPTAAKDLFDVLGFQHTRTRKDKSGKDMLEFYLDLYRRDDPAGRSGLHAAAG